MKSLHNNYLNKSAVYQEKVKPEAHKNRKINVAALYSIFLISQYTRTIMCVYAHDHADVVRVMLNWYTRPKISENNRRASLQKMYFYS